MATTNKAVILQRRMPEAPEEGLVIEQLPVPSPGEGEVLVRFLLRPINPSDCMRVAGRYAPVEPGAVAGLEGLAEVVESGQGASRFKPGQRVVGIPFGTGTWQQLAVVKEANLFPVDGRVNDEDAAQFLVNPATIVAMLEAVDVPSGGYLLLTAAGSVLGKMGIQLAKHKGIKAIAAVRRREQVEELRALGAHEVVVTGEEDLPTRVHEITGGAGAWAALDAVGGEMLGKVVASVRTYGTVLLYGLLSGDTASFRIVDVLNKSISVTGFVLFGYLNHTKKTDEEKQAFWASVMELLATGVITPHTGRRYPLDQVKEAMQESVRVGRGGKVLLEG